MNSRRDFFRQFAGQAGVLRDDFRGVECIPLNRLNELPESVASQIEPVFFVEASFEIHNSILEVNTGKSSRKKLIELSNTELKAFDCFKEHKTLQQSSLEIMTTSGMDYDDAYRVVSSLFFRLASLMICHPKDAHPISELLNK
jgi:hypothetical protein